SARRHPKPCSTTIFPSMLRSCCKHALRRVGRNARNLRKRGQFRRIQGWTRNDIKSYLWLNSGNRFDSLSRGHRYGKVYNRNLPKWYKREPDSRIPIVESPERIHLFVVGGHAGRFSAFIPGWGHMSTPVLRPIDLSARASDGECADGMCKL